ncbi:UNVERIFIED_CONTAM: Retrovirus-related Pol polyprotein from transposon TNT 1-94 [Sesamum angustifolium]|uniref:Retrovirus-related Pol polyprotein from transposon TNT 1-94 n=1 Tax=Sesamum angustifolium TaxID=2727405 RepID=A0AAW2Q963_9LAMI
MTFHGAITSQEKKEWMSAIVEEMEYLQKNHPSELVQLPEGKKVIGCKWVCRKKPTVLEKEGEKFKAQFVAKGYSQQKGIDYDEICSHVGRHTSIRTVLALEQMDAKITFLHGDLEEQTYMEQPNGFTQPGHEHLVCKLKKSFYGLKESPRQRYKQFDSYMLQIGCKQCGGPMCWKSTVQSIVALSTTEVEYMAVAEDAKEALWLNRLSKKTGY